MIKKAISKKGFTLTEALIAVAILAIFVSMAAVGTSGMFGTGEQMMAVSKAAVLGSDVMQAITNELRFGEDFYIIDESASEESKKKIYVTTIYEDNKPSIITVKQISFSSATYGENSTISVSVGGETIKASSSDALPITLPKGCLIVKSTQYGSDRISIPISTAAYDEIYISDLTFSYVYKESTEERKDENGNKVTVTKYTCSGIKVDLEISSSSENKPLWSNSVQIYPLYLKTK